MTNKELQTAGTIFSNFYQRMYDGDLQDTRVDSRMSDIHDAMCKNNPDYLPFVQAAAECRQDIFISDRECAAIALTYLQLRGITIY